MIAETFPGTYDGTGVQTPPPRRQRRGNFGPNAPMGVHVTQPLAFRCADLEAVRQFLMTCRYVSDQRQFGRRDYWMPPQEFEQRRRGDCDDFALWTWRQLLALGYSARFVGGRHGRYGAGHAWVTIERDGRVFIVEALAAPFGPTFPRLSTLHYKPLVSVSWDGRTLKYFKHQPAQRPASFSDVLPHLPEWSTFWLRTRPRVWWSRARRLLGRDL